MPAWAWPDSLGGFAGGAAQRLFGWVLADVGPGRLMPWLAVSFGFGAILYFAAEQEPALWAALALAVGTIVAAVLVRHRPVGFPLMCMRDAIDKRIRAVLSGDQAAIASALITGKRDAISTSVNDAMFISGIGHVLSISGYHMVVVSGIVFVVLRALLALCAPGRLPIKKWAALAALGAATFYLLLSGAEVATQRSYIMVAIVLIGVMFDRPTLTLRTLTVAALAVLLLAPEAIVHPSFQMSFAATLAIVAGYQGGFAVMRANPIRRWARGLRSSACARSWAWC